MKDPSSPVQVGPVVGTGAEAHQIVTVGSWQFRALVSHKDEPRVRDLDLAERLGYVRPRKIRDLIRQLIEDGKLLGVLRRPTAGRTKMAGKNADGTPRFETVEVDEFWLTEGQALKVIAKSETDVADALLDEMIEVFRLAIRGLLTPAQASGAGDRLSQFLLSERQPLARFMSTALITEISRIYGYGHLAGNKPPRLIIGAIGRLYEAVFGEQIHAQMKERGQERKLYEFLTSDAHRMAQRDLAILETLARQSFSPEEFWQRVDAQFKGFALQGSLLLS